MLYGSPGRGLGWTRTGASGRERNPGLETGDQGWLAETGGEMPRPQECGGWGGDEVFRRPLQASILQVGTLSSEQGSICLEQVSWIRKENSALPSSPLAVQPLNKRTRWGRRPSSTPKCLGMGVMNGWKGGKEKREGGRRTVKMI